MKSSPAADTANTGDVDAASTSTTIGRSVSARDWRRGNAAAMEAMPMVPDRGYCKPAVVIRRTRRARFYFAAAAYGLNLRKSVRDRPEIGGQAHAGLEQLLVDRLDVVVLVGAVDEEEVVELRGVRHVHVAQQLRRVDLSHCQRVCPLDPGDRVARGPARLGRGVEGEDAGVELVDVGVVVFAGLDDHELVPDCRECLVGD